MEHKESTLGFAMWIYQVSKGVRTDDPNDEIQIQDLIIDDHHGESVTLGDITIALMPASNGFPMDQACDILVKVHGKVVERFDNRIPPYTIAPVE